MDEETNVDGELNTENEELEANEIDNALDTQESATDEETSEVQDGDDYGSNAGTTARDRAKAQIDRLKEENRTLKEKLRSTGGERGGAQGDQEGSLASSDLVSRTYLATKGFQLEEVQDKAIERAKRLGTTVDQLLKDPDERALLDNAVKRLTSQRASSRPTGKGGMRSKDAQWYVDNNVMPDDPKLISQVWNILANRDR